MSTQGQKPRYTRREALAGAGALGAGLVLGGAAGFGIAKGSESSAPVRGGTSGRPVTIGASIPLTGYAASDGADMQHALQMAVDELNSRGGIAGGKVSLKLLDAGPFAPDVMSNNFKRLITESNVDVIVGGYQANSGAELDVCADGAMLYVHNNTLQADADKVSANPQRYWGIFQHDATEIWYARALPGFLDGIEASGKWKPINRNIAIINGNNPFSAGLTSEFQKVAPTTHWNISSIEEVTTPNTEWGATLAKIRANPPGVIWLTEYFPADDASFMKQFLQNPTRSLVHIQYGPSVPDFYNLAGTAANGVVWANILNVLPDDIGDAWIKAYTQRFNTPPGLSQGPGIYDAVHLYAQAASIAGGPQDRKAIASIIRAMIYRGVCGGRYLNYPDQTDRPYPAGVKDAALGMPLMFYQVQNLKSVAIFPDPFVRGTFATPPWLA